MRGEFIRAWSYMWPEVWQRLTNHPEAGREVLCEIYKAVEELPARLAQGQHRPTALKAPVDEETDLTLRNDPEAAANFFEQLSGRRFVSERHATRALERVDLALDESYPPTVAARFRALIKGFVKRHGLHYRLAEPLSFRPNVAGIFCGLVSQLQEIGEVDQHFGQLFSECEEAFDDLRDRPSEARIKSCIAKQMNVAEALARNHCLANHIEVRQFRNGQEVVVPNPALSAMLHELHTWPHTGVKNSLRNYYTFTNSYPGIRHPGDARAALRPLGLRDAIAGLVLTLGFAAYLTDGFDHSRVYGV